MTATESLPDFLSGCRSVLGADRVRLDVSPEGSGALPRRVPAVLEASTLDDVRAVVELANRHRVPVAPMSTGRNWGFGSGVPSADGTCLLSLRRMNRIREINTVFGFAVVEAGVTQGELADALSSLGAPWVLDVTGAGRDTSLVGNALERGIAYHSQRTETTRAFEIVLGNGAVFRTGFQDPRVALLNRLYSHGIGPDPSGLFQQSRFGVVTAMTIDLQPKPLGHVSVGLNVEADRMPDLIDALRRLKAEGVVDGIPHIANRVRFFSTLVPVLRRRSSRALSREAAERHMSRLFPKPWTMLTSLRGPELLIRARSRLLRRALGGFGRLILMTPTMRRLQRLAGLFLPSVKAVMEATESIQGLPLGIPSDDPLSFLDYDPARDGPPLPIERHPRGFVYLTPLMPADGKTARRFLAALPALARAAGQEPGVTFNALDGRVLEAVVSVTFDKSDEGALRRLLATGEGWLADLRSLGAHTYRVHVDHMAQTGVSADPWREVQNRLRAVFDPNGVLSPGRYDPQ